MNRFVILAGAAAVAVATSTIPASAACNGDTSSETVLGAGSGALVGGLASHSIAGAAVGGVAGGLIGHSIGRSNNREDCRRAARAYDREAARDRYPDGRYVDRQGNRHFDDDED